MRNTFVIASGICVLLTGCSGLTSSRWAMDDPQYAEKYSESYSEDDNKFARMLKQSADARFLVGSTGIYGELGVLGAGVGGMYLPTSWSEVRIGAQGMLNSGDPSAGINLGLRVQTPTRLAAFAGIGSYLGAGDIDATDDGLDNDNNGRIDEPGEEDRETVFSVYPEAGVHFWLNPRFRVSALGQYHFTPEGGVDDFGYGGLQFTLLK